MNFNAWISIYFLKVDFIFTLEKFVKTILIIKKHNAFQFNIMIKYFNHKNCENMNPVF